MVWQAIGAIGGAVLNGIFGHSSAQQQMTNQLALNKESYGYTKKLQKQSFGYNKELQNLSFGLSKKLQAYQNAYTTKMASSAHQIEVGDLRKAGLNPILSATGGNGASFSTGGATVGAGSVGSGSVGSGQASAPDYGDAVAAYQSYLNTKATNSSIELNEKQGENLDKDSALKDSLNKTEIERKSNVIAERNAINQRINNETAATAAQINKMNKEGDAALINAYAHQLESSANAKFQNERARGFTQEDSYNNSKHGSTKVFGSGVEGGTSSGYTHRITY